MLTYEFDEVLLSNRVLSVKVFNKVSEEWVKFILENRKHRVKNKHSFDIVVGPIADDGVVCQLNRYKQKMINLATLVKELTYKKLNNQYYFGTPTAISYLKKL